MLFDVSRGRATFYQGKKNCESADLLQTRGGGRALVPAMDAAMNAVQDTYGKGQCNFNASLPRPYRAPGV